MLKKIKNFVLYCIAIGFGFILLSPSVPFWETFFGVLRFVVWGLPFEIIANPFAVWMASLGNTQSTLGLFISFTFLAAYYLGCFLAFAAWIHVPNAPPSDPFWDNEFYWLLGLKSTKELQDAEVQANAIVHAMNKQNRHQ